MKYKSRKSPRNFLLFPKELPRHFMTTMGPSFEWRIKRGGIGEGGKRIYSVEQCKTNETQQQERFQKFMIVGKNMFDMVKQMEKILDRKILIYQEYSGQLVQICGEYMIPEDDTRTYDEYLNEMGLAA